MVTISRDSPCLSITAVAKDRLPVFRTSAGFLIFAYVMMPDHLHIITNGGHKPSDTLRYIKGISAHRIIQHLKEGGFEGSLQKLRGARKTDRQEHSLWQRESNVVLLTVESTFLQRVHYIHQNRVRAGLVERAEDYRWSSVRFWNRCVTDDEPLQVDFDKIVWRTPR